MKIVIDLDGTICSLRKEGQHYSQVSVNPGAVEKIKELKEKGHYIILQTARHMETCKGNIGLVNAKVSKTTLDWLEKNEIPYDEIFFGKPNADIYLDDNSKTFLGWDSVDDMVNYDDRLVNVVIPIAGAGSRFKNAGFASPKPLIDVKGMTMVEWAVKSFDFLKTDYHVNLIFVVHKDHLQYSMDSHIKEMFPQSTVIIQESDLRGQADTVLMAKKYINDYNKLIIYNGDTYSNYVLSDFPIGDKTLDGIIPCFYSEDPRYSFAKTDEYGYVEEVAEKKVISHNATNGLYYFRKGIDFVKFAEKMIDKNQKQNGEFYVGPLYTDLINSGRRVKICTIQQNRILGTPEELQYFLANYKG